MKQASLTGDTYKIGEVAEDLGLATSVLRFWEDEFEQLQPRRTPKGQRVYSENDVELLRQIKYLLHEQGMTIEGAKRVLSGEISGPGLNEPGEQAASNPANPADPRLLRLAVAELQDIRNLLQLS